MTNDEAKKMLEAKLKCLIAETSGTNHDCNMRLCDGCSLNYEQGNMGEQKKALNMAIKALEQTRWIPVSERLPKEDGMYLISTCMNCIDTCLFYKDDDEYVWVDYEDSVRAWMPLPQPYKAESEGEE